MLKIKDLQVKVGEKVILNRFCLEMNAGEIHVLMGPNGVGKSTLSKVLMRDANYEVLGDIQFDGQNLLQMSTEEIAKKGVFFIQQNPIEIAGVTNAELLRTALNERGETITNVLEFHNSLRSLCKKLDIPESFIHRDVNYNMSGGEKKKNELLHMWVLKPKFIILDEIDSGLDVDALKLVATSIKEYYEEYKPSVLIITHQKSLLDLIKPQFVHVLYNKKILKSGDFSLAEKIFKEGFSGAGIIEESENHE